MTDVSERVIRGGEGDNSTRQQEPHSYGSAIMHIVTKGRKPAAGKETQDELQASYANTAHGPVILDLIDTEVTEIPVSIHAAPWFSTLREIYHGGVSVEVTTLASDERPGKRRQERYVISPEARRYIQQHDAESRKGVEPDGVHELTPDGERVWGEIADYVDGSRKLPSVAYCTLADMVAIRSAITDIAGDEIEQGFIDGQSPERVRLRQTAIRIDKVLSFWSAVPIQKRPTKRASGGMGFVQVKDGDPELANRVNQFANCVGVDPDLFFPERGGSTKEAREVCRGCVVRDDCLELALQRGEKFGIWGGMSERQRRSIRRKRRQQS